MVSLSKHVISLLTNQGMSEETIILHLKTGTFCYSHMKVRTACKGTSCLGPSHSNILCPVPTGTVCCVFHKGAGEEGSIPGIPHKRTSWNTGRHHACSLFSHSSPHSHGVQLEMYEEVQQVVLGF